MKKLLLILLLCFIFNACNNPADAKQYTDAQSYAHSVYSTDGERVGTCRRENDVMFQLYDMNNKKVTNPAAFLKQSPDDCYLFNAKGYAYGKCTSTRVILWK